LELAVRAVLRTRVGGRRHRCGRVGSITLASDNLRLPLPLLSGTYSLFLSSLLTLPGGFNHHSAITFYFFIPLLTSYRVKRTGDGRVELSVNKVNPR
jgi:hypothetical protein